MNNGDIVYWNWKHKQCNWHRSITHHLEKIGCPLKVKIKGSEKISAFHGKYFEFEWTDNETTEKTGQSWWSAPSVTLFIKPQRKLTMKPVTVTVDNRESIFP